MSDDYEGPCRTCGSPDVLVVNATGDLSVGDVTRPVERERICRGDDCRTNRPGERRMEDVV